MTATEQKWFERVRAWRDSGLSAEKFSTGRGFAANSLRQWSSLMRRRGVAESPTRIRFARVERESPVATPAAVTVEVGEARVSIPPGTDAATVRAVLDALRGSEGGSR